MMYEPVKCKTPSCSHILLNYRFIKPPASLLDVDTRQDSLLSVYSIPVGQLTVASLQPGAEARVLDLIPGQQPLQVPRG